MPYRLRRYRELGPVGIARLDSAGDQLRSRLADRSGYDDHRYDWSLNAPGYQPDYAQ